MLTYVLICLLFVLLGLSGFQFAYMFYFDRLDRERKHHVRTLERRASRLAARLRAAEARIAEQEAAIEHFRAASTTEDEAWAEVIEDA